MRPAILVQVLQGEAHFVAALFDGGTNGHFHVVRGCFLAEREQVLVLLQGRRPEFHRFFPCCRWSPAVFLKKSRRVPQAVNGQNVVQCLQFTVESAGFQHPVIQGVPDHFAVRVDGVDHCGEVLQLVEDGIQTNCLRARVVNNVRWVAADKPRLELLGDGR